MGVFFAPSGEGVFEGGLEGDWKGIGRGLEGEEGRV